MASKDIERLLSKMGKTEKEMDTIWNELKKTNRVAIALSKAGKDWRSLNLSVIKELPTQREYDLKQAEKEKREAVEKVSKANKEKETRKYYNEHFLEIMIKKIDNGEHLTESELRRFEEYGNIVSEGENGRWSQGIVSRIEYNGRYFEIVWERGLTEYQKDEYMDQPYEVELIVERKLIPAHTEVIENWVKKSKV